MRIFHSGTLLADDSNLAVGRVPNGLTWNGQAIMDVVQFFRAANAVVYGRSKGPMVFGFSVLASFATEAECVTFCCTHGDVLPLQADLLLTDTAATYALRMAGAVANVSIGVRIGHTVPVQYSFTGSRFLSEDVPETDPEDVDVTKYGSENPAADDEEIAVVFGTPFGAEPRFFSLTLEPAAGQPPFAVIGYKSISAAGFTAILSGALPTSGYIARWKAEL